MSGEATLVVARGWIEHAGNHSVCLAGVAFTFREGTDIEEEFFLNPVHT
jgi:hypothetical protein